MPTCLLFPNIYNLCAKICCCGATKSDFYNQELASMKKARHQEDLLDQYFQDKGIKIKDICYEDSPEVNIARHKAHERLGFGYLAIFRTMRFLLVLMAIMAGLMLANGLRNYFSKT